MAEQKMRKNSKRRRNWRRVTVSVSEELYEIIEERARQAGVSISRFAFSMLKRKKVIVVPGMAEFVQQLKEISRSLKKDQCDSWLLKEMISSINRNVDFFEAATQGVMYPRLIENEQDGVTVRGQQNQFSKNMIEV